ncbi:hypothetical protein Misp01_43550 [Microtetraspora sp. NBRC 13810]|uniref:DUF2332 domain-containing protein n=1 Tax=Microtetraspora sp. NBRC 13810 TaxID=3030990 RepID=UPI0024A55B4E|nr:DUF2332 domain-containing protein [Microtetraspora sp. NBRC 13810]GLW09226.1 hypothetical protein Misp01_43550 [Microtetraspora sp. NBRC 13810]
MDTAERYRAFAREEVAGHSPVYEKLAADIAADPGLIALIDGLPPVKRQPNLLLAAARFLGGPVEDSGAFRDWAAAHWTGLAGTILARSTQTNEIGRCASLLPLLAALPQPLALIEVGASAGLCLYPDRYGYRYDDRPPIGAGAGPLVLTCRTNGEVPVPERLPRVVWRAGIDLNPLDVREEATLRWLECLVWPGQDDRLARLRGAALAAVADPPHLVRGDMNDVIREVVAQAPPDATPVVYHSAVMPYLDEEARDRFVATMRDLPARWISNEGSPRLPSVRARLTRPLPEGRLAFLLALDEEPVATAGPHGEWLDWLGG